MTSSRVPMPDLFRPDTPYGKDSTTVTPYIWVPDRGLADFLIRVFDAVETNVMDNPGHGIHRELRIGN